MLDMTQADLAQKVSCSVSMLRKIERDQRRPSEQLAELLADELAIDDSQQPQFIQMARGQFVPDMPVASGPEFEPAVTPQSTNQQTVIRNPFIISSGAVLLLVIALLLLSGAFNNWFGSPSSDNSGESGEPADKIIAGMDESEIENGSQSTTPTAVNAAAAEPVTQPLAGTTVIIEGPFCTSVTEIY